jgi:hypothetical protein
LLGNGTFKVHIALTDDRMRQSNELAGNTHKGDFVVVINVNFLMFEKSATKNKLVTFGLKGNYTEQAGGEVSAHFCS